MRVELGEPADRTAATLEDAIKRKYRGGWCRWRGERQCDIGESAPVQPRLPIVVNPPFSSRFLLV